MIHFQNKGGASRRAHIMSALPRKLARPATGGENTGRHKHVGSRHERVNRDVKGKKTEG